ncbi:VanZ family protein [Nonlabens marinus]|uniref:VanZ family protein n=1 Tax=Nonlabens marinus TaxID=930802 RepID=UPI0005A23D56|nr:VanZ family protein [Nonlabens marinus]
MQKLLYWLAPFYTLLVAYGSLADSPPLPNIQLTNIDKVYHALGYMVMFFLWYLFFYHRFLEKQTHFEYSLRTILSSWSSTIAIAAAFFSLIIGGLIELGQGYFSEYRSMDVYDMMANTVGIIIAALLVYSASNLFYRS